MSGFVERDGVVLFELTSSKASRWHAWDCRCAGTWESLEAAHLTPAGIRTVPHPNASVLACTWDGIAIPAPDATWEDQQAATGILFTALRTPVTD